MKTRFLSLIIALAILITTGGVYAAWAYAEDDLKAVHSHVGFAISDATRNTGKGTFKVDTSGCSLTVDPKAEKDYHVSLTIAGDVTFTFTPTDAWMGSNSTSVGGVATLPNTIEMQYGLTTTSTSDSNKVTLGTETPKIFSTIDKTTKTSITLNKAENNGEITYTVTSPLRTLLTQAGDGTASLLVLNDDVYLSTYAEYEAYAKAIGSFGNIGIEISEPAAVGPA
jgi:hypothetical protein